MDSWFLPINALFIVLYNVESILPLTLVVVLRSGLTTGSIARYGLPGDCMKILLSLRLPLLHIPVSLVKAHIEKTKFVQVGTFCTSNLSSGTALQQHFVIRKVGSKHLMMNIFAAVHFA